MEITKENYSPWTLNLRSETEKTKFWKYRCDDVREQFTYITVIICMIYVRAWIKFLKKKRLYDFHIRSRQCTYLDFACYVMV